MSRFLADRFALLDAYIPGEQPSDMEYIKLNTNEMPFPPPDKVQAAVESELGKMHLYPNPDGSGLINRLAEFYGVNPENVIIGNGSDELLAFSFLAFFETGVVFPDITYGFYPVYARLYNVPYREIPLLDDLTIDINDYIAIDENIILANPNAPTGITVGLDDIEAMTGSNQNKVVVIDEAYIDFGGESAVHLTKKQKNLLVIHTYSKSRSMAGARLGFAIGSPPLIDDLKKMKYSFNPYNVNRLTQAMGAAALDSEALYTEKRREIMNVREYAGDRLKNLGFTLTNSKANFLFCKHPDIGGYELYSKLKEKGILVRQWDKPRIKDHVRITIGTREQMDALVAAVEEIVDSK